MASMRRGTARPLGNHDCARLWLQDAKPIAYAVTIGIVAAATGLGVAIAPFVSGAQLTTLFLAVSVSTLLGGVGIGLVSIVLSAVSAWIFLLPPTFSLGVSDPGEVYALVMFVLVASLIVLTIGWLQTATLRLEAGRHRAVMLEQRALADEALHRWKDVIENVDLGISVVDPHSNTIRFANDALADLHGVPLESIIGIPLFDLYAPIEHDRVAGFYNTADRVGSVEFEADRSRHGSNFPARVHVTSVRDVHDVLIYRIVTVADISGQRRLEGELHQAQRLEAVGQLTAGVAHDFNNLLQGIMANLELLCDELHEQREARLLVGSVLRIAEHGGALTRHLLSFSRQQVLRPTDLKLAAFLEAFRQTLSRTLDPRIKVEIAADADLPPVWIDASHLETALLNLAINSRDAMPSGGRLLITASNGPTDGDTAAAGMAVIRVSDSGTGIAPELLAKVCEPFFTTKGLNGSGLGLSMVYGFAKQSGGDLRITSQPGVGTCVEMWLPLMAVAREAPALAVG